MAPMTKNERAMPSSVFHDTACERIALNVALLFGVALLASVGLGSNVNETSGSADIAMLAASTGSERMTKTPMAESKNEHPPNMMMVRDPRRENASNQVRSSRIAKKPERARPMS